MSKILAVSDIHIYDYPQRNPIPLSRLHQSRTVANNIIKVASQENAEYLVLAGDILEKSINRPYVLAEVKNFLDTLMGYFKQGFLIYGNHDQDNKGSDSNFTDSSLSVMLPPNLFYADKKELLIDNTRIAFSNWRPEFDLSWINGCVDVLFTHATIAYSDTVDMFSSQVLDESKFSLAICGDIHKPGMTGKYVSIGIPQKCKMGDCDSSTGVIYDCVNKSWKWVNLNPDDNLIKFQYTSDKFKEGWDSTTGTWLVYKPINLGLIKKDNIKVPAWKEIEHLIDSVVIQSNLQNIHGEILKNIKNIDSKEIDFNFVLTRLYCKNWRSIDEVELFFEDGDKILITGKNGSGKSSLLSALKYAFIENRYLKDFIQFGTKECVTEVDFIYQGNSYRIQRGSKKYGLLVNNISQKYNNKKEFEEDIRQRFPFIDYLEYFFFDSDHNKLIGELTPEAKSELVSKFFKLDKIDLYNEEANILLNSYTENLRQWKEEIEKSQKLLDYLNSKLNTITIPKISKVDLENHKKEGLEIQRKSKIWTDYLLSVANLTARIQNYSESLKQVEDKMNNFRNLEIIDNDMKKIKSRIHEINSNIIPNINNISLEYNNVSNSLKQVDDEGIKLHNEYLNLGKSKICPNCGQEIKNVDVLNKHKEELEQRLNELRNKHNSFKRELDILKNKRIQADELYKQINTELNKLNENLANLISEKKTIETTKNNYNDLLNNLSKCKNNLENTDVPEKVELPEHFMETMSRIESEINVWNELENLMNDKKTAEYNINLAKTELNKISDSVDELQKYIKLTGPTGKIYEEIMTKLADQFSDNQVKYEVMTYNFRKKDRLDLALSFNNNGNWVGYQACSSGQQTVLDINFMNKIITRMGLVVMDEFLKHLDPYNHDVCIEAISNMNIGCILLSSHMETISSFNNKSCNMELNNSGITKITLK